jgi:hypothetical protein
LVDDDGAAAVFAAVDDGPFFGFGAALVGGDFGDEPAVGGEAGGEDVAVEKHGDEVLVAGVFEVGWIREDEVVAGGVALEEGGGFGADDAAVFEAGFFEIGGDDLVGVAVFIDEDAGGGAAAEGLEAERAGAGE